MCQENPHKMALNWGNRGRLGYAEHFEALSRYLYNDFSGFLRHYGESQGSFTTILEKVTILTTEWHHKVLI